VKRRSEAGKVSFPSAVVGILVVGAGVSTARLLGKAAERAPESVAERNIVKFDLHHDRIAISPGERGTVHLPLLEFEIDTPPTQAHKVTAWLEGSDGERLQLRQVKEEPSTRVFGRLGFERPLKSPKLVVQNDGKTVLEKPLAAFPPPMRAIPLVVPIDPTIRLRPVARAQAKELERLYPGDVFFRIETKAGESCQIPTHILRTDWSANAEVAFPLKGSRKSPVIGLPKKETGRIAELDQPQLSFLNSVQEVDFEFETFKKNGRSGIRVPKAQTVRFPDGARIEIEAQERMVAGAKPAFGLSIREVGGSGPLIAPVKKPFAIEPMPPTNREMGRFPEFDGINQNRMELVSPALEEMGITRLRIGPHQLNAKTEKPLVLGKHRLRLRFFRKFIQGIDRRRFVEIES
jgi:hypothetical protein